MYHPVRHLRGFAVLGASCAAMTIGLIGLILVGCQQQAPAPPPLIRTYTSLPPKQGIPPYLKGTIWELTDRNNDEPYATSTYGLVQGLRGAGDSTASLQVRQWMVKQLTVHGFGSRLQPGYEHIGPEQVLRDP